MRFKKKNVLIIGAGRSGISAAKFLVRKGANVTIFDDEQAAREETAVDCGALFHFNAETLKIMDFNAVVLSPGVSVNHPLAKHFQEKLISELALGYSQKPKRSAAVTGTNGKTTVVHLVHNALQEQGRRSQLCGNVGIPVTGVNLKKSVAVTEVSSFMLEIPENSLTKKFKFRPRISCILNITQDHLERHVTMENYVASKAAITQHQRKRDILILNYDDENCRAIGRRATCKVLYFSQEARVQGIYLDGKSVILNIGKEAKVVATLEDFNEYKKHSVYNILASTLILKLLRVKSSAIISSYVGRRVQHEHRIEHVSTIDGVSYYNDSKATNVAAAVAACASFNLPTHLLVGGISKGQDFSILFKQLPKTVENVLAFGASAEAIAEAAIAAKFERVKVFENMPEALVGAKEAAVAPCVVLLSPACASFDEYNGYADRGKKFVELVSEYVKD